MRFSGRRSARRGHQSAKEKRGRLKKKPHERPPPGGSIERGSVIARYVKGLGKGEERV